MLKNILDAKITLNRQQKIALAITAVYAVITFLLCSRHEMWGDEINVWMALRHYSFPELLKFSSKAGNPIFFFLPLWPFVKLGCSAFFIKYFCWICSVFAVFLLNFFSPFRLITKILITFGAPMLYHYSVLSRCYSVLPPLMFLTAMLYPYACGQGQPEKAKLPKNTALILYACAIAAIACTHIITFVFSGGLAVLFFYENFYKKKNFGKAEKTAAAIMDLGIITVIAQTLYALSSNKVFEANSVICLDAVSAVKMYFSSMADAFSSSLFRGTLPSEILANYFAWAIAVLFIAGIALMFLRKKMFALITMGTFLFYVYISVTRYGEMFPYRTYISLLCMASFFWAALNDKTCTKRTKTGIEFIAAAIMALTVPTGILTAKADWNNNFSSAYETAMFVEKNIPDDGKSVIVSAAVPVAYYLPERTLYYGRNVPLRTILPGMGTGINLADFMGEYDNIYVIVSSLQKNMMEGQELVYQSAYALVPQENFCIYRIRL